MSIFKRENTVKKTKNKKRGVIYCRVSDLRQVDGYSLEIQERDCRLLAELNNIEVVKLFKDEGVSGKTTFREEFQAMIDFVMDNYTEIDYIIFYQLTRISRRLLDILELVELLNDLGIEFLSHKDGINDGVYGKFTLQLLGSLAELEIGQLKERVVPSMLARAMEGKHNGGRYNPYGYDKKEFKINGKIEKRLVINKYEAEQVKLIYHLYTENITGDDKLGHYLISKRLIEMGYKYRKNEKGEEQNWTSKRVSNVLSEKNSYYYIGYIDWGRYGTRPKKVLNSKTNKLEVVLNDKRKPVMERFENDSWVNAKGIQEAIITPEVYELYKKRRENTEKPTTKNKGRNAVYHLTRLLRCQDCGGVMDASKENNGLVYKCRKATSMPGTCHSNTLKYDYIKDEVETVFFSYLKLMVFSNIPKVILSEVVKFSRESKIDKRIIDIKAEMENLERIAIKSLEEFEKKQNPSKFEINVYNKRFEERKIQYESLEVELKELNSQDVNVTINDKLMNNIINYIDNIDCIEDYYNNLELQVQIDLYRKIFEKILVTKQKVNSEGKKVVGKKTIKNIEFFINFESINFFDLGNISEMYKNKSIINKNEKIKELIDGQDYFFLFDILITELITLNKNINFKVKDNYIDSKIFLTNAQLALHYKDIKFDDSVLQNLQEPEIIEIQSNLTEEDKLFLEQLKVKENGES